MVASIASRKAVSIASSLREYGFTIFGLAHTLHPNVFSLKFDRKAVVRHSRDRAWARLVAENAEFWRAELVLPVDFIDVETFALEHEYFEEKGLILVAPSYRSVKLAADKEKLPSLLRETAKCPKQVTVKSADDVNKIEELRPPLVVKGLGDAANPEFFPTWEMATQRVGERAPCLVQEYVPGIGRGYYTVALHGEPILEFTHQRIIEYDPIGGASLAAMGPVLDPRLFELGRKIVKLLDWSGPLMVETKFVPEKGEYYVVELNPKFWGSLDLPVSLGYHFPAVLAVAYSEGIEKAKKLVSSFKVRNGNFYWVLDGLRYLAKSPKTWMRILQGMLYKGKSDLEVSDAGRVALQFTWGLVRLQREKEKWKQSIFRDIRKLEWWTHRLKNLNTKTIVFDLDGTLVDIPVDWKKAKSALVEEGYLKPWEGITEALRKLWVTDMSAYIMASSTLEEIELQAAQSAKPLVDPAIFHIVSLPVTIVTLQTSRVAKVALEKAGYKQLSWQVIGREKLGPLKELSFQTLSNPSLIIEDNLLNAIAAMRAGHLPVLVARDTYNVVKALRLGLPSINHSDIPSLLELISKIQQNC